MIHFYTGGLLDLHQSIRSTVYKVTRYRKKSLTIILNDISNNPFTTYLQRQTDRFEMKKQKIDNATTT